MSTKFNPDWDILEATQESLREHMMLCGEMSIQMRRMERAFETILRLTDDKQIKKICADMQNTEKRLGPQ